jgi:hypothetical protein
MGFLVTLVTLATSGCASAQSTAQTTNKGTATNPAKPPAPSDAPASKFNVLLAGGLTVGADIPTIVTKAFTCTPVAHLKKGDPFAPTFGGDSIYSLDTWLFHFDESFMPHQLEVPILGMVKSSRGSVYPMYPAILKPSIDIKAGDTPRLDGYVIATNKAVRAGDSIPVFVFAGGAIMSIMHIEGTKLITESKPSFVVYEGSVKLADRPILLEMWRAVRFYAANL